MSDPGAPWGQNWLQGAEHPTSNRPPNGEAMNEPNTDAAPESPPLPTADEPDELFCVDCELSGVLLDNVKVSGDSELTRGRISIHVRAKTLAGAVGVHPSCDPRTCSG